MNEKIIKKIEQNQNLVKFCNRILNYNFIFENEITRSMFLVSLISADSLTDEHACDETIDIANFILNHIDLFILEDNIKKDIISKMKSAIKIAKRDKKEFFIKRVEKIIDNGK
jgi:uncharacterized ubiquitin-like protein YukD